MLANGALAFLLASSCATRSVAPLPTHDPVTYRWSQASGGLHVYAEPIVESERARRFFGFDARAARVLPVLIAFENRGSTSSYRIGPDLIALDGSAGGAPIRVGSKSAETIHAVSVLLMIVPFVGAAAAIASIPAGGSAAQQRSDATVALHQIAATRLRAHTLSPGETERAVVFLAFEHGVPLPTEVTLTLGAEELGGRVAPRFAFSIPLAGSFE